MEIDRYIEHAGHKTLHAQGGARPLLDESLNRLVGVLEALAIHIHLDRSPYQLDLHPDHHGERLGVGDGLYLSDLPHLNTAEDDRRSDMQAIDGAVKEQDIGQLFGEELPAT